MTDPSATQSVTIAFLTDPATHGGRPVERIDTHAAVVVLAGDRAYKLKRAVRYPYLDFSTPQKRAAACAAEVDLNRRTAPDLYLGAVPVVRRAGGALALGGEGEEVVDTVVVMRRFPDDMLFDRLADAGRLTPDLMRDLADRIAAFHADAARCTGFPAAAAMRAVVAGNLDELRAHADVFDPAAVARLAGRSLAALDRLSALMEERAGAGFVRHGHGDLHLRNIVLLDGRPTLFDALEFDADLATVDVLYDLAFLLMDLEQRGARPLGNAVLNRYLEAAGGIEGLALLPLFLSARAAIRAKTAASAAAVQPDPGAAAARRVEAVAYLARALALIEPPPARLVAVGGLSGTGKTTLARALAPDLGPAPGAVVLRSDGLRKRLFGVPEEQRLPADAYTPAVTERVYAQLADQAAAALAAGHAVVADAVHALPAERAAIEAVAARCGVPFSGIWLDAPATLRCDRIRGRAPDASDATEAVALRQETYELGELTWQRIDAGAAPDALYAEARNSLA